MGSDAPGFYHAIEETALQTLEQGLCGWKVVDCAVFLTELGYDRPMTVAADFRNLTPILVMRALQQAGTRIYEPCQAFEVEVPEDSLGIVMRHLSTHGAELAESVPVGHKAVLVTGEIPSRLVQDVAVALPALTQGEAVLFAYPGLDRAIRGEAPLRPRTDGNPLNFEEYMGYLSRGGCSASVADAHAAAIPPIRTLNRCHILRYGYISVLWSQASW